MAKCDLPSCTNEATQTISVETVRHEVCSYHYAKWAERFSARKDKDDAD